MNLESILNDAWNMGSVFGVHRFLHGIHVNPLNDYIDRRCIRSTDAS